MIHNNIFELENMKKLPKYVKTYDGYIGVYQYTDHGFPVYRFPGGDRIAEQWELENGSNDRIEIENKIYK